MLENMSAAIDRVDNIKSHFASLRTKGVVGIAPHMVGGELGKRDDISPDSGSFSVYLNRSIDQLTNVASGNPGDNSQYTEIIEQASDRWGVDSSLIKAVIKAESGFRNGAVSSAGAQGLMQLLPATAKSLGVTDPFDPSQNIMAGTRYLKGQLERFDNRVELALAAYNAGPAAVKKYGGIPPYNETQNYVKRVLGYRESYSR